MENREIKYRIWNPETREMRVIKKCDYLGFTGIVDQSEGSNKGVWMQFSGLMDKNDKEIYEGDIAKTGVDCIFIVQWDEENGRFLGFTAESERRIIYVGREQRVEVIGNIYENPEIFSNKV